MFQSLVDDKESLQEAVLHENVERELRQLILDNDLFWASIESLVSVLEPICDGIAIIALQIFLMYSIKLKAR